MLSVMRGFRVEGTVAVRTVALECTHVDTRIVCVEGAAPMVPLTNTQKHQLISTQLVGVVEVSARMYFTGIRISHDRLQITRCR